MKSLPLVSIITPTYNSEKYIYETLNSVYNQNYQNIEYIIIDGKSSDNTLNIVKEFPNITLISEKDSGMYDAINKGIRIAKGQILTYLNSDDLLYPDTINRVVKKYLIEKNDIFIGYCDFINENGKKLYTHRFPFISKNICLKLGRMPFNQPSVFWTKKWMDKTGLFDTQYKYAGDLEFFIRLLNTNKISIIRKSIAKFRIHNNQLSSNMKVHNQEIINILKKYNISRKYSENVYALIYNILLRLLNINGIFNKETIIFFMKQYTRVATF